MESNRFLFFEKNDTICKESDKMDCLFCKIIEGSIDSFTLYEDEIVKVFLDAYPDAPGHLLIIPKKHILDLDDMDSNTWNHIFQIIQKMKKRLEEKLHVDGVTLIQNNGMVQEIKHFHLHMKPFYKEKKELSKEEVFELLKED